MLIFNNTYFDYYKISYTIIKIYLVFYSKVIPIFYKFNLFLYKYLRSFNFEILLFSNFNLKIYKFLKSSNYYVNIFISEISLNL